MEIISLLIGAIGALSGVGFGLYQVREKRRERARAEEAERVQARMAEELANARRAQEALLDVEEADARERKRASRRATTEARRYNSKMEAEATARRRSERKATREQKAHQKKLEKEAAAQRKATEKAARDAQREARRRKK